MGRAGCASRECPSRRLSLRPRRPAGPRLRSSFPHVLPRLALAVLLCAVIGMGGTANAQTTVASDWPLKPSGLSAGDQFRLLFLSSGTRQPTLASLTSYDIWWIQKEVGGGHSAIQSHSSLFKVLGCTSTDDARDHTSTRYTSADKGVPIYWLNGAKVADDYEDFYDGDWDSNSPKDEDGNAVSSGNDSRAFTGCEDDGTVDSGNPIGTVNVRIGRADTNGKELHDPEKTSHASVSRSMYGLSGVFQVAGTTPVWTATLVSNTGQSSSSFYEDLDDEWAGQFTTGSYAKGYAVTGVDVLFRTIPGTYTPSDLSVEIWSNAADNRPGSLLHSLTSPGSMAAGTVSFTISITTLSPSTSYWVVLDDQNSNKATIHRTNSTAEDSGAATGWSIGTTKTGSNFSEDHNHYLQFAVKGAVVANTAPTASNGSVTADEDTAYAFQASDFNFADADSGDTLAKIKITVVESAGDLELDGTDVTVDDEVTKAQLDAGDLVFTPAADANGSPYATFKFKVNDGVDDSASAYTMTVNVTAVNDAPSGKPSITGAATLGQTLSADTMGIADADGLSSPGWTYQWVRQDDSDGTNAQDISGETGSTYTLVQADLNKYIAVKVGFTDDSGTTEDAIKSDAAGPVALSDTTAPSVDSATVNGAWLVITFDEDLAAAANLANAAFAVKKTPKGGSEETVTLSATTGPSISGKTVTLPLAAAAVHSDTGFKVSYTEPGTGTNNKLKDAAGNAVASFTDRAVTNGTANTAPTASNGSVTADEDTAYAFQASDFNFADADSGDTLAKIKITVVESAGDLELDGTDVTVDDEVTKAQLDAGDLVFTPAADANGSPYATFKFKVNDGVDDSASAYTMTVNVTAVNDAPSGKPSITGAATLGQTLSADTMGIADADGLSSPGWTYQWVRQDDSDGTNAQDISGETGSTYTLVQADLNKYIAVKVGFTDDSGTTEDAIKSDAAGPVALSDTTAPSVDSATVNGAWLVITFDEDLAAAANLANAAFAVKKTPKGGSEETVTLSATTGPSISGKTVTLPLAAAAVHSDTGFKVSYTEPGTGTNNKLKDAAGNAVASFAAQTVTNNTPSAPVLSTEVEVWIAGSRFPWVGETLEARYSGLGDAEVPWQWVRQDDAQGTNAEDIPGATSSSYTTVAADRGKWIGLKLTYEDDTGTARTLRTDATGAVRVSTIEYARPAPTGAWIDGDLLTVAWSERLRGKTPCDSEEACRRSARFGPAGAFEVKVNGAARALAGFEVSGSEVRLRVAPAVEYGDTVTVSYDAPEEPQESHRGIEDGDFNPARTFEDLAVENRVLTIGGKPVLTIDDAEASESDGKIVFTIRLSKPLTNADENFVFSTLSGTADGGNVDYRGVSQFERLPTGVTAFTWEVGLVNDAVPEGSETFRFRIGTHSGGPSLSVVFPGGGTETYGTGTIHDDGDTPPGAPQGLRATPGAGQATLRWSEGHRGSHAITGYAYRQSSDGGTTWGTWTTVTGGGSATSQVVTGLTNGTAYTFELRAASAAGGGRRPGLGAGDGDALRQRDAGERHLDGRGDVRGEIG